jgi:hypothetical protein
VITAPYRSFADPSVTRRALLLLDVMGHAPDGIVTLPGDTLSRSRPFSAIAYEHTLTIQAASLLVARGQAKRLTDRDVPAFQLIAP